VPLLVAGSAQRDEIFLHIAAELTAILLMMDLQIGNEKHNSGGASRRAVRFCFLARVIAFLKIRLMPDKQGKNRQQFLVFALFPLKSPLLPCNLSR
jgi:hypothetical protein